METMSVELANLYARIQRAINSNLAATKSNYWTTTLCTTFFKDIRSSFEWHSIPPLIRSISYTNPTKAFNRLIRSFGHEVIKRYINDAIYYSATPLVNTDTEHQISFDSHTHSLTLAHNLRDYITNWIQMDANTKIAFKWDRDACVSFFTILHDSDMWLVIPDSIKHYIASNPVRAFNNLLKQYGIPTKRVSIGGRTKFTVNFQHLLFTYQ